MKLLASFDKSIHLYLLKRLSFAIE